MSLGREAGACRAALPRRWRSYGSTLTSSTQSSGQGRATVLSYRKQLGLDAERQADRYNLSGIGVFNWAIGIGQRSSDRLLLLRRGVGAGALYVREHRPDGKPGGGTTSLAHGRRMLTNEAPSSNPTAPTTPWRLVLCSAATSSNPSCPIVGVRVPTYLRPTRDRYLASDPRWLVFVLMASWRS